MCILVAEEKFLKCPSLFKQKFVQLSEPSSLDFVFFDFEFTWLCFLNAMDAVSQFSEHLLKLPKRT